MAGQSARRGRLRGRGRSPSLRRSSYQRELEHFNGLTRLRRLDLEKTQLTDAGMAAGSKFFRAAAVTICTYWKMKIRSEQP